MGPGGLSGSAAVGARCARRKCPGGRKASGTPRYPHIVVLITLGSGGTLFLGCGVYCGGACEPSLGVSQRGPHPAAACPSRDMATVGCCNWSVDLVVMAAVVARSRGTPHGLGRLENRALHQGVEMKSCLAPRAG